MRDRKEIVSSGFGRYRLLERLGQGGMAEVFKAKSFGVEGFEKTLVIKRILPELSQSQEFVEMFVHEAKLAVRLSHANIVQVFDLGKAPAREMAAQLSHGDAYYIAMEYVHGLDLASVLARCRREQIALSVAMAAYVGSEVAKGLDHAHRRRDEQMRPLGIVHCDVSPQNVLLSFEGEVKVTDFGIAKARGVLDHDEPERTRARTLQGKFSYMSPEQSRGASVDARSDLFSLGTIIYECVAGVNPFSAPTKFETLRRVQACEYPPLALLRPDVPPDLLAVLKTAMAKSPADRYADAGRMYEALLAFLYAHGGRYGGHDLAEFLAGFPSIEPLGPVEPMLEADAGSPTERTALELAEVDHISRGQASFIEHALDMGERREVTALVIELAREPTHDVVEKAVRIIGLWGGRVSQREAGHIAALFGLGDTDGRDTEMATRCALVALHGLEPLRPPGIGVHVGRIHVSRTGEPADDDGLSTLFDAARDLSRARNGQVAISTQAMHQVKALFEFDVLRDGDESTHAIPGVSVKQVRGRGVGPGRFVGRKQELRRIGVALALAAKRKPQLLTIRGDHGSGKTRLLHEVERRLRKGGYDVGFHIATCPPRGIESPLSGMVCMLHVLCGTTEGDPPERIQAVEPRLRALGLQEDEVRAVLKPLGTGVASLAGDGNTLLRHAFARMVQSLCADRPYTFAWDAAHAIDEDTFAILREVLQRCVHTRVVFVLAARAGFSHPLEQIEGHVAIDLGDLSAPEVERLVALRFGIDVVPEELLRFVRARAGGHPLFIEEVIRALVDVGAVSVVDGHVVSMKLVKQDLALPKTLRGLVGSRVSRLPVEERAVLQAAAVLGGPVDTAVLSTMLSRGMPSIERSIATLVERDFVVHTGPSELQFTSPIVSEVVADALTNESAREMHSAAGRALEETLGERACEQAARIARHLYEAGDRERAAFYFAKSGERRLATTELEAAALDSARAIALTNPTMRDPRELVSWLETWAAAVRFARSSPDAKELCDRVIERADRAGTRESRVRARVAAGHLLAAGHSIEDGRMRLTEAALIAASHLQLVKPVLLAEVELATRQGDFRRALVLLDELGAVAHAASDNVEEHRVALHLARSHAAVGNPATAIAKLQEAERLRPADRIAIFERTTIRALVDYSMRDFRAAALRSEEAIHLAREMGLTHEVMHNLHKLGDCLVRLEDTPRAYGAIQQSLALCEESGDARFANCNRMLLAFLDGINEASDGARLLREGIAYAASREFTWDVIGGRLLLAKLLSRLNRVDDARIEYEALGALALEAGYRLVADDCEIALAEPQVRADVPMNAPSDQLRDT